MLLFRPSKDMISSSSSSRATAVTRCALRGSTRNNVVRRPNSTLSSGAGRRIPRGAIAATKNLSLPASVQYSTEQVLKLRGSKLAEKQVLYDSNKESENCGVGLIANLKSKPSRHVVEVADEMLVRMSHRGGCGCDPNSGDGAGR